MAERIAAAMLTSAGFGPSVARVTSAGTLAREDEPMHPDAAAALASLGLDASGFRGRRLREGLVAEADLVLCATREHRAAVVRVLPGALRRTFTLREVRRAAALGRLPAAPRGADAAAALRAAGVALAARALTGRTDASTGPSPRDADLADPLIGGPEAFTSCAATIASILAEPLRLISDAARGSAKPADSSEPAWPPDQPTAARGLARGR
jgi:protein-tyrosine phosphatase